MNPLVPFSIDPQAAKTQIGVKKVVNSTSHNEMPSMPNW